MLFMIIICTILISKGVKLQNSGTTLSPQNTCPCKKPPGSNQCLTYQPQYAAATMEEVVMNFVDTTALDATSATNMLGLEPAYKNANGISKCDNKKCLDCSKAVMRHLLNSLTINNNLT